MTWSLLRRAARSARLTGPGEAAPSPPGASDIRLISGGSTGTLAADCRRQENFPPMRTIPQLAALPAFALALALAGAAHADKLLFSGEHAIKFSHNGVIKEVTASGTGVAIANGSGSGSSGPLNTLHLTRPFAKITRTVNATTPGVGIDEIRFQGVRINPALAGPHGIPGVFAP